MLHLYALVDGICYKKRLSLCKHECLDLPTAVCVQLIMSGIIRSKKSPGLVLPPPQLIELLPGKSIDRGMCLLYMYM